MGQSDRPPTENLIWEFASAGVYVALDGRFRVSRRRFAEFPGWYLIDNGRQSEMRLDTLDRAKYRAFWIHNQKALREPDTEYMISAIDKDFIRAWYDGRDRFDGPIAKTPGYLSIDYSFVGGIVNYRHSKTGITVKLYIDDGSFEIVSRAFEREALKSYLSKQLSSGAFDSLSAIVRHGSGT